MDIDAGSVVGAGGGIFASFLAVIEIYRRWNAVKADADGKKIGSAYESQMYQELRQVKAENRKLNDLLLRQSEEIGQLKADLQHAQSDLKQYKLLMDSALKGFDSLKAENALMKAQLEGKANLPTKAFGRVT